MRYIKKGNIPASLNSEETNKKRQEIIDNGSYIDKSKYNVCYNALDIKSELERVYNGKCAYCEQEQEIMEVDHYRPKSVYYWFAFSWDNLLLCCHSCNSKKGKRFPVSNSLLLSIPLPANIHWSGKDFDSVELPELVNPENDTTPDSHFAFDREGNIRGVDNKGRKTIDVCGLNRLKLKDKRKKVLDVLEKEIKEYELLFGLQGRNYAVNKFIKTIEESDKNEFLAFRKHILQNEIKKLY